MLLNKRAERMSGEFSCFCGWRRAPWRLGTGEGGEGYDPSDGAGVAIRQLVTRRLHARRQRPDFGRRVAGETLQWPILHRPSSAAYCAARLVMGPVARASRRSIDRGILGGRTIKAADIGSLSPARGIIGPVTINLEAVSADRSVIAGAHAGRAGGRRASPRKARGVRTASTPKSIGMIFGQRAWHALRYGA
jgi:hypothetical protein